MRKVLRLEKKEENEKLVEFLEYWSESRKEWGVTLNNPSDWDNVMYRETISGLDYFVCWVNGECEVTQYRGHLNSGKF